MAILLQFLTFVYVCTLIISYIHTDYYSKSYNKDIAKKPSSWNFSPQFYLFENQLKSLNLASEHVLKKEERRSV